MWASCCSSGSANWPTVCVSVRHRESQLSPCSCSALLCNSPKGCCSVMLVRDRVFSALRRKWPPCRSCGRPYPAAPHTRTGTKSWVRAWAPAEYVCGAGFRCVSVALRAEESPGPASGARVKCLFWDPSGGTVSLPGKGRFDWRGQAALGRSSPLLWQVRPMTPLPRSLAHQDFLREDRGSSGGAPPAARLTRRGNTCNVKLTLLTTCRCGFGGVRCIRAVRPQDCFISQTETLCPLPLTPHSAPSPAPGPSPVTHQDLSICPSCPA